MELLHVFQTLVLVNVPMVSFPRIIVSNHTAKLVSVVIQDTSLYQYLTSIYHRGTRMTKPQVHIRQVDLIQCNTADVFRTVKAIKLKLATNVLITNLPVLLVHQKSVLAQTVPLQITK